MCKGKCRHKCKSPCKIGDLVQLKVGIDLYKNALVTKRFDNRIVFVRYNIGENDREIKIIEKYLYVLNKTCYLNV